LALSDQLGITARPLSTMVRVNRQVDLRRIRRICRDHAVARIIVGYPLHISGAAGEMAVEAARFAARLEKETGLATELLDERLTSWEAKQTLTESRPSRGRGRKPIDDIAAAVLLREYLEQTSRDVDESKTEND
jgi:putative Holliday junction resolvase